MTEQTHLKWVSTLKHIDQGLDHTKMLLTAETIYQELKVNFGMNY